jgi:hypothetical protein
MLKKIPRLFLHLHGQCEFFGSSYFIPNIPLLTIVNTPTLYKPFAPHLYNLEKNLIKTTASKHQRMRQVNNR